MSEIIVVPHPQLSDYEKVNFSTEVAFNSLITEAKKLGLELEPVMGLMYLPDQKTTQQFQEAVEPYLIL